MTAQPIAQGLAGLGRNGDSMLVHMQPREVAGLQSLAMAHGGSLTINPETGLPEAGFLGDVLGAVAPVALGGLLSMTGMGPLAAGLLTGAATWAVTGDPLKGVMGGFGAYGGYGLGDDLMQFGTVAKTPTTSLLGDTATKVGSDIIKTPGLDSIIGATGSPSANLVSSVADDVVAQTPWDKLSAGAGKALNTPVDFLKQSSRGWQNAATVASPLLTMGSKAPLMPNLGSVASQTSKYEGPYTTQPRDMRMPTAEEQLQLAAAGTPEFNYFGVSNPVPGYQKFAEGGSIADGGDMSLYGNPDSSGDGSQLSNEGYGLGRLNRMYGGGVFQYADGGAIPQVGGPQMPMGIPATGAVGAPNMDDAGLKALLNNAITDPMGRTQLPPLALAAMGQSPDNEVGLPPLARASLGLGMAKGGYLNGPGDGMSDSIPASINGQHPARLADGEFVVPADVVSHLGNGSTKAGAKVLYGMMDKVRKARTGTKKQGRQINPHRFVPA